MGADEDINDISAENLRTEYQEVCQNHRAISDFRAKLLTLLPLASGTGIFLLLREQNDPLDPGHIAAIGVFGFVVTLGLFFHELRGIKHCGDLIRRGKRLEEKLRLTEGQFAMDYEYYNPDGGGKIVRKILHQLIGPAGAAWIIYPSVCVGWLYVAAVGFEIPITVFLLFLGVLIVAVILWGAVLLLKLRAAAETKDAPRPKPN